MPKKPTIDWSQLPDKGPAAQRETLINLLLGVIESLKAELENDSQQSKALESQNEKLLKSIIDKEAVNEKLLKSIIDAVTDIGSKESANEKLMKPISDALDGLKSELKKGSQQSKALSENLVNATKTMAEVGKNQIKSKTLLQEADKNREWDMEVIRDRRGLIKSIKAKEIQRKEL